MTPAASLKHVPLTPTDSSPDGHPLISSSSLHRTNSSSLDVWEYSPGSFEWCADADHSACVLSGSGRVHLSDGRVVRLRPGTTLFLPMGMRGRWEVEDTLRTIALHQSQ